MNKKWILKRRSSAERQFDTFPLAFRAMFLEMKKESEKGKAIIDLAKEYKIISPVSRTYSYLDAVDMATNNGVLNPDGQLNSKEFRR